MYKFFFDGESAAFGALELVTSPTNRNEYLEPLQMDNLSQTVTYCTIKKVNKKFNFIKLINFIRIERPEKMNFKREERFSILQFYVFKLWKWFKTLLKGKIDGHWMSVSV